MTTIMEYFGTEEDAIERVEQIKEKEEYNFIMRSPRIKDNPPDKQFGVQWGDVSGV